MAFDDLPLDRQTPDRHPFQEPPEPERGSLLRWIAIAVVCVVAIGLLAFWWMSRSQPDPSAAPTPTAREATSPEAPEPQPLTLPALEESDTFIRDLVGTLSNHPTLARVVATPAIVRSTAVGVIQIGDGRTPVEWFRVLRPTSRLQISGTESGTITAESHARWNEATEAITSVAPADAAQLYVNVRPLLEEAYDDLGQPDGDFDQAILRAASTLRATPDLPSPPQIARRPGYFEFEDPALRSLRPIQKQLLLLGPANRRALMSWMDEFLREAGLE